jgi:hypothetical protein
VSAPDHSRHHHEELARAAAAAMERHYAECIEICSELLTAGLYGQWASADPEPARAARAETRLLMANAMHHNDAHYDDLVRVLNAALDSPPEVQKDAWFTLAVVHASFDQPAAARDAMQHCLDLIPRLRRHAPSAEALDQLEAEARRFLAECLPPSASGSS